MVAHKFSTTTIITTIVIIIMTSNIDLSSSLVCYNCKEENEYCRDTFTAYDADIPDCEGKFCGKMSYLNDGQSVVQRNCISDQNSTIGCSQLTTNGVSKTICICDLDYCNHSSILISFGYWKYLLITMMMMMIVVN